MVPPTYGVWGKVCKNVCNKGYYFGLFKLDSKSKTCGGLQINSSGTRGKHTFVPTHYDELPVPQGSWQLGNDLRQRKHNLRLYGGIIFFLFTLSVLKASGKFFFNWAPPPLPTGEGGSIGCKVVKKTC